METVCLANWANLRKEERRRLAVEGGMEERWSRYLVMLAFDKRKGRVRRETY